MSPPLRGRDRFDATPGSEADAAWARADYYAALSKGAAEQGRDSIAQAHLDRADDEADNAMDWDELESWLAAADGRDEEDLLDDLRLPLGDDGDDLPGRTHEPVNDAHLGELTDQMADHFSDEAAGYGDGR